MIEFKLGEILQELNISQNKFAKQANVRPNTINSMCNNKTKRIEVETLNSILKILNTVGQKNYTASDLILYVER